MIWANLLHLGFNLWDDHLNTPEHPAYDEKGERRPVAWGVSTAVRFDERVWHDLTQRTRDIGMNMVVIDLGEAVVYPSHPELAVKGSWAPAKLREELSRLRKIEAEVDDPGFAVKPGKPATAGENKHAELKAFLELDAEGYDQIPCATNWNNPLDMELVADFALRRIAPERLKGFLFATWESMLDDPKSLAKHDEYFKLAGKIIRDHS